RHTHWGTPSVRNFLPTRKTLPGSQLSIHESQTEMLADENIWIEKLGTMAPNGYNLMPGG
ncbi:GIY-YIG nuclease family protein, partial [Sinorhizobium meliloti]|uniref:hypothetical protein n=1 Tax=Rhizobium meliloti TaxID=382 RepID=UPI001AECEB88